MDVKELKNKLIRHYQHKIELHAHTKPVSGCSDVTPQALVETYSKLGYGAVVVTNHFLLTDKFSKKEYIDRYLNDYTEAKEYGDEIGMNVYLGAEIRFTENSNEYLIYGLDKTMLEEIYDLLPYGVEQFRKTYSMPNSVFIQAHPMRDGIKRVSPELLDGIEAFNMHPHHNSRVALAALYAKEEQHTIITAGTDYHHANKDHEGLTAIRTTYLPKDTFGLAKLLKDGDYLLEIARGNIIL